MAEKLLNNRQQVIDAFKAGIFPYKDRFPTEEKPEEKSEEESEEEWEEKSEEESEEESDEQHNFEKFIEYIENESKEINYELFKQYFEDPAPSVLIRKFYKMKNRKRNNRFVKMIKDGLNDLKEETNYMSKEEKELQNIDKSTDIVEEILDFNQKKNKKDKA